MGIQNQLLQKQSNLYKYKYDPTYMIIVSIAFIQGINSLSDLSIIYLYKDDFKLNPSQMSQAQGITHFPWILKPIFGLISDGIYFFGYRRKSYLILCGVVQCFCWIILSQIVRTTAQGIATLFMIQMCISFINVIGEALLVEVSRNTNNLKVSDEEKQSKASKNVSIFFTFTNLGKFLTAYSGGLLLEYMDKRQVFLCTSLFPAILLIMTLFYQEKKCQKFSQNINYSSLSDSDEQTTLINSLNKFSNTDESEIYNSKECSNYQKVVKFIRKDEICKPIMMIFLFMIAPSTSASMFFFYTNHLKFSPSFMGSLKLVHSVAHITGIIIYNAYLKFTPFPKLFTISSIICSIVGLSQILLILRINTKLGIPDHFFCICDSMIIQTVAEINTIPLLVLACRLCPKNIEGTMYALLMSVINLGSMFSYQFGGLFMWILNINSNNFENLYILIIITNLSLLLPLPFIQASSFENAYKVAEIDELDEEQEQSCFLSTDSDQQNFFFNETNSLQSNEENSQEIKNISMTKITQNGDPTQLETILETQEEHLDTSNLMKDIKQLQTDYHDLGCNQQELLNYCQFESDIQFQLQFSQDINSDIDIIILNQTQKDQYKEHVAHKLNNLNISKKMFTILKNMIVLTINKLN